MSRILPFLLALSGTASADDVLMVFDAVDGPFVSELLTEAGHAPKLGTDGVGDPLVRATAGDTQFVVLFYSCTDHVACQELQLRTWHTDRELTTAAVNTYNQQQRLGRAYIDAKGNPTVESLIRLHGGVTREHIAAEVTAFLKSVALFDASLDEDTPAPADEAKAE